MITPISEKKQQKKNTKWVKEDTHVEKKWDDLR